MGTRTNKLFEVLLLELVCYVPLAIIAGNILPALGSFKIHWLYIGITFIFTLLVLIPRKSVYGLFLLIIAFAVIQIFTSISFSIVAYIDFISGPLLFVAVVNIVISNNLEQRVYKRYRKKILIGLSVPIIIALLQYMKILPLEFMNARYVNVTVYGAEVLERVNGFLYHGVELAVIIFFFFVNISLRTSYIKTYLTLASMVFFEYITLIKTGILTSLLYTAFYSYFIDRRLRSFKTAAIAAIFFVGFSYIYILVPDLQADRFTFDDRDFKFEDQLFTGRGYIWNVYIDGIQKFNYFQIAFGGGFGSAPLVFKQGLFGGDLPNGWSPGPHNQLLELFVNGGLFAILLIVLILRKQYQKLSASFQNDVAEFKKFFLAILLIPPLIIGVTAPIMSMFIYWCGLSAAVIGLKVKFS